MGNQVDVSQITRNDILTFREWWHERIKSKGLTANSSNKDFSYLGQVLIYARDDKKLDLDVSSLLTRVRFTETASTRPPFPTGFILNNLLDLNNLNDLNTECRLFLFAMADTGARHNLPRSRPVFQTRPGEFRRWSFHL